MAKTFVSWGYFTSRCTRRVKNVKRSYLHGHKHMHLNQFVEHFALLPPPNKVMFLVLSVCLPVE